MGTEALNGEENSFASQIDSLLQETDEDDNMGGEVPPPEACHQMILHLRTDLIQEVSRLRELSEVYYFLCDVLTEGKPAPLARLAMPAACYKAEGDVSPPSVEVSLTDIAGRPTGLAMQAVAEAGESYAASWTRVRDIATRACRACDQLATHSAAPTEALAANLAESL